MKERNEKRWKDMLAGGLIVAAVAGLAVPALAATGSRQVWVDYSDIKLVINGETVTPRDGDGSVVEPFTIDGTTYLPVRAVADALGMDVDWNDSTNTITLTDPALADNGDYIGKARAKEIALDHAGLTYDDVSFFRVELDRNGGRAEYEVEFYSGSTEYDYDIDALTGDVRDYDHDVEGYQIPSDSADGSGDYIGKARAKEIALDHAGLQSSQVTFIRTELDWDDGRAEYEVEFYTSGKEYDYDIDALTGDIRSYDYDAEYYNGGTGSTTASITAERAREIAPNHAGLTASQVTFARADLDRDDGRLVYDVEFYTSDYKEYDYEIDASTGAVLSYDYDAEHYSRPSNGGSTSTGAAISEARAREIALAQVSGAADSNIRKVELDRDDGRLQYEVKIVYNNMEYDFDIDASTGTILSRDVESVWD